MFTISQVQSMVGINASTIRYYENEGILSDISRNQGGRRVYTEEQVNWLKFVLALKESGMTIEDIKRYVQLIFQGESTIKERRDFLAEHKEKVERQMAQTQLHLERITQKITYYDVTVLKKNYLDL